jgi:hypothetical protein
MATTEAPDQPGDNRAGSAPAQREYPERPSAAPQPAATPPEPPKRRSQEHPARNRLRGYSALLITLIAAMGAIVTWRAEVAATKAAELTQSGVVIAINLGAEQSQDRAQAMGEAADVTRVQQLLDERNMLGDELSLAPAGPAKARLKTDYGVAYWVAEWQLRNDWPDNFYLSNARTAPNYDIARRTADLVAESRIPTNSAAFFSQASDQQNTRRDLLLLDIGLVIGLACATVAHQLTRRGRLQTSCAAAGTAVLALGLAAFLVLEV